MKKISLITVCFNSESTVIDTLKSVADQTYSNIEHIVIDGGSTDSTMELVSQYGSRVSKSISEKDKGIYDAYNKGLLLATGEIIGFINSDDFYFSDETILKVMSVFEDSTIEACHANLIYVNSINTNIIKRLWKSWDFKDSDFKKGSIPAHPTVFFRRDVYERFGNFDINFKLVADHDFLLRAFYVNKIKSVYIDEPWVRMRSGGATGGNLKSIIKQNLQIRAAQKKNGINSSLLIFIVTKFLDRIKQSFKSNYNKSFFNS
ncbi:glycosyltransferase [Gammaproteobacteria bacterium]|nr:glycosyltransferase [Gammaproteobacteria bacterium]MDA9101833.1 glycosyltransferase [Gammaproteobacteria bacterium]